MDTAIRKRGGHKGSITKLLRTYLEVLAREDKLEIITLRDNLKSNLDKIDKLNESIYDLITDEEELTKEMVAANDYSLNVCRVIHELQEELDKMKLSSDVGKRLGESKHRISLPDIELPKFDGDPANYHKFLVSFESLISKYSLSSFEKFSYLSKQLTGPAKTLVESLSLKDLSYEAAVQLLNEAFSDTLTQQYSVISSLSKLTLNNDAVDAFKWISQARVIRDQVSTLKIDASIFVQYFLWNSLCDTFKKEVTAITGKSKPSLDEIMDSVFEANDRFVQVQSKKVNTVKPKVLSLATNVTDKPETSRYKCNLCFYDKEPNAGDHRLSFCPKYTDPKSRVDRLEAINCCIKCGSLEHNIKNCRTKLNPCRKCNKFHMSYLCYPSLKSVKSKEKSKLQIGSPNKGKKVAIGSKNTSNNMLTANYNSQIHNDVILPTGTVFVNKDGCRTPWRVFKDLGSQTTFVKGSPDNIPNCKVIDKVKLNVKGINSEKTHDSFLVEFPVDIPGQGEQVIRAVCLETIRTAIDVPGLKSVVNHFNSKGYRLADINLDKVKDRVDNISILLGSDQNHIFPLVQHNFSEMGKPPSTYFNTPSGIMLAGSVSQYLSNINSLPKFKLDKPI